MAELVKGLFGGAKSAVSSAASDADDFADFATAASPAAPSHAASSAFNAASNTPAAGAGGLFAPPVGMTGRPYTKWYRVWERVTIADFQQELFIIPLILVAVLVNLWGSYVNKKRAKQWAATHLPLLEAEYASVGFDSAKKGSNTSDVSAKAMADGTDLSDKLMRQKGKNEYITYATGRQNVACLEVQLSLFKRYNPVAWFAELLLSFFFESMSAPAERVEVTAHPFDGKEKSLVTETEGPVKDSTFDGFVWAIVHKDKMKQLRDDRYDLSLTATRDHAKLPDWATIMSESAEVTEVMLTPDLIKAVTEAGEDLEALIVTDQPIDAPKKLDETVPKKRVTLSMKLNPAATSTLFQYFLRMPDQLVNTGRFRAEAMRKIRATREEEMRKIRKLDEEEKAEERRLAGDKMKKEERERKLKGMGAEEQRKFLEREKQQEQKKGMKKRTMKG